MRQRAVSRVVVHFWIGHFALTHSHFYDSRRQIASEQ